MLYRTTNAFFIDLYKNPQKTLPTFAVLCCRCSTIPCWLVSCYKLWCVGAAG